MFDVWFKYEIFTQEEGKPVKIRESTNDNLDHGYPTEYASWWLEFPDLESAKKHAGVSRVGCLGSRVTVFVNGKERKEDT